MSDTVSQLLHAALALPDDERAELAELLNASVEVTPSRLHPDWPAELRRRVAEIESGEVKPIPWDEARLQIQAQLDAGGLSNG